MLRPMTPVVRPMTKLLALVFILNAVCLAAQNRAVQPQGSERSGGGDANIRIRVDRVPVLFSALDRKDRYITDLTRDEIAVYDSKKKQEIIEFSRETNLPLRIALLIDTSNSIRDRFRFEQAAAIEFLQTVLRPQMDRAFLVAFDTNVEVVQDFTDDINKLRTGIESLRAGGGTALYDAIYHAVLEKLMKAEPEGSVRRTIVLLSDGEDNQSRVTREETLEMAQRGEVTIYVIGTNITRIQRRGDKVLRRFAEQTGGRIFFPFKLSDLTSSFRQIGHELRSQYVLLFRPSTPRDGAFHTIKVVARRKGVTVRARKGYYALEE